MVKLFKYLKKKDWLFMFFCLGLVVVQVWLDLEMPDYTSKLTEAVASGNVAMRDVWVNGGYMMLCALGSVAASVLCGFFAARIAANFAKTVRSELFSKVLTFSNTEINSFSTPSLITRTTNDVVQLQNFIAIGLQLIIKAPILAIWAICKISGTSIEWTMATIITVCIIVLVVVVLVAICYPKFKEIQKLTDDLNNATRESVSGVRVVRAFNAEKYQSKKFEKVNKKVTDNHLFTARRMGIMMPVMTLCMNGLSIAIYWIGAYLINDAATVPERVTLLGNMTAFTQYALQVVMAFMLLVAICIILPRVLVSAKRVNEVLDATPAIEDGIWTEGEKGYALEFNDVSFVYPSGQEQTLSNISFKVNKGETIAFIGATGNGKSTVVSLIERFYDVTDGEILMDGVNIKDYTEETLRNKISYASQKAVLFKGDIRSNITYGDDTPPSEETEAKIQKALEISQAAEFVSRLPDGLNSEVAQGGTNFSGGQKQRLSIARAVYKNSDLMIFDDTFSALDYKTDMLVRKAIKENLSDTTVIIVAQRIGTIMGADKIVVLDEGKIAGMGTHKELLENCPVYKEIALSQLSKEEL